MNAQSPMPIEIAEAEAPDPPEKRRIRRVLMSAGVVCMLVVVAYFYLTGGRYESTENAMLQTGMVAISPTVAGKVVAVAVHENQRVHKGDVLFRIEPASFETSLADAEAQLASARTDVGSLQADYRAALSEIDTARAKAGFAGREAARQQALLNEGIASRAQAEAAALEVSTAREAIVTARAHAESLRARLAGISDNIDAQPDVRRAASRLAKARIDLRDTTVRAPQDGIVTRVNQLQVGNYVQPGRPVFMLAGLSFWVQANFKESQVRHMRVGQPAAILIDAFPDAELKGRIESFSPGTGNSFSVLPPENATGNWIKVVQRLPVQISLQTLPPGLPLSTGMSVEVTVDTGHRRHLFSADTPPAEPRSVSRR